MERSKKRKNGHKINIKLKHQRHVSTTAVHTTVTLNNMFSLAGMQVVRPETSRITDFCDQDKNERNS